MLTREAKILKAAALIEKQKRNQERRYFEFFKKAWQVQEPETELELNWHIEYLCDYFQKVIENVANKIPQKSVIINISPRSTKSKIISVNLAPWAWINYPWLKFINSSHSAGLSTEHSVQSRWLIESEWYQNNWGNRYQMLTDQNVKNSYANNRGGTRLAVSVGQKVSGRGCDIVIADDLVDPEDSDAKSAIEKANSHFSSGLYTRLNDKKSGVRILVMQRVAENDVTGNELSIRPEKYNHICIPSEDSEEVKPVELRTNYKEGLFDSNRFNRGVLDDVKRNIGSLKYAGQFLQKPMSVGGNIFKSQWWKFYDELPKIMDRWIQSWDLSFDEGDNASFVVGQVWGKKGNNAYLVYEYRKQIGFTDQLKAFAHVSELFPMARKKLVEKKANGAALINTLTNKIVGITPVEPKGSKENRAISVSPNVEIGLVYLPNKDNNQWVVDFIQECATFPNGKHNDRIDAMSQALDDFYGTSSDRLKRLLGDL